MKNVVFILLLMPLIAGAQSFHPAGGLPGSNAIHKDSNVFVAWANGIYLERGYLDIADTNYTLAGSNKASFGTANNALGMAEGTATDIVSLGDGGSAVMMFEHPIKNGPGYDFAVFENSFSDTYLELAHVAVSTDGINYVYFESTSENSILQQIGPFGQMQPEYLNNLAGKYKGGYGVPFDLEELIGESMIDLDNIRFVKVIDCVGSIDPNFGTEDAFGTLINDPYPTPFESGGFDLDAVGVIHQQNNLSIDESSKVQVSVYPNPTSGQVCVNLQTQDAYQIQVFDLRGKLISENSGLGSKTSVFIDGEPGVYLLKVFTERGLYQQRIIKQP